VAKKFSLKDNPIFQRLEAPEPREAGPLAEEALPSQDASRSPPFQEPSSAGQNLTLRDRPSEGRPQDVTPPEPPEQRAHLTAVGAPVQSPQTAPAAQDLGLKAHLDKSLFFGFFNEMVDELLPMLDPTEQVLYIRLFRLSYGFNQNYCTVSQSLLIERTGFSRNTIRTSLQSLAQKGWIGIVEAGNRVSTTYRVVLPREKTGQSQNSGVNSDPQNVPLTKRPSNPDGQNMTPNMRGSAVDPHGGQNLDLQTLTLRKRSSESVEEPNVYVRGSNVEGQELPPLLKTFTGNSLTLHTGERGLNTEGQNLPLNSLTLSARELVDKFYSRLGQRPSKAKREKSIEECLSLLLEGFTVEEVDYAITWLIQQHPATGSFSRLSHFIDQAIKDRQTGQRARELEQQQDREAERQWAERQRLGEERQQIEEVKASLPQGTLEELYQEAARLVEQESPNLKFGKDLIIRIKLNELVKLRYLS
jgi:Helix-turn-helix domain